MLMTRCAASCYQRRQRASAAPLIADGLPHRSLWTLDFFWIAARFLAAGSLSLPEVRGRFKVLQHVIYEAEVILALVVGHVRWEGAERHSRIQRPTGQFAASMNQHTGKRLPRSRTVRFSVYQIICTREVGLRIAEVTEENYFQNCCCQLPAICHKRRATDGSCCGTARA